jgi:hypothetical protein
MPRRGRVYYTYFWLREDGTPYYVGKGHGDRAFRNHYRCGKLWANPPRDKNNILLQEHSIEKDAIVAERFFILYYGRKNLGTGVLRNLTDGGEGVSGLRCTASTREKLSRAFKGKPLSAEHRRNVGLGLLGRPCSDKTRHLIQVAQVGKSRPQTTGRLNGLAKLTEEQVLEIRKRELPYRKLAQKFGVSKTTICDVVKRRSWAWIA